MHMGLCACICRCLFFLHIFVNACFVSVLGFGVKVSFTRGNTVLPPHSIFPVISAHSFVPASYSSCTCLPTESENMVILCECICVTVKLFTLLGVGWCKFCIIFSGLLLARQDAQRAVSLVYYVGTAQIADESRYAACCVTGLLCWNSPNC